MLPSVKIAKDRLRDTNHEYLPILGLLEFRESVTKLTLGEDAHACLIEKVSAMTNTNGSILNPLV